MASKRASRNAAPAPSTRTRSRAGARKPGTGVPNGAPQAASSATTRGKRARNAPAPSNVATTAEQRARKRTKSAPERPPPTKPTPLKKSTPPKKQKEATKVSPVINEVPRQVLRVFVFGSGENGELGLGPGRTQALRPRRNPFLDPDGRSGFHAVQLDCGGMHTIALTSRNEIVTWGVNDDGALGRDTSWEGGLRDVDADSDEEDGELNPAESTPAEIPDSCFPEGTMFVSVAAGDSCSFALTETGFVYGWGTFTNAKGDKKFGYDAAGNPIRIQETPSLIPGLEKITQIACGANHALALDSRGRVSGWGVGDKNQLGRRPFGRHQETLVPSVVRIWRQPTRYIASGEHHSFAVDARGDVWAWGLNNWGQAGDAAGAGGDEAALPHPMRIADLCGRGVRVLGGGDHYSAAVTVAGECLAWGRIDGGHLGIKFSARQLADETLVRHDEYGKPRMCLRPTLVPVRRAVHVGCGSAHAIFVNAERKAFAAGLGSSGQLGTGREEDEGVAREIGGKGLGDGELVWAGAGGQFSVVAAAVA